MLIATRPRLFHPRILASRLCAVGIFELMLVNQSPHQGQLAGDLLAFAGLALVALAVVGRLWCSLYISGYKNNELITAGPYSMTRNPLYFFSLLGFAGVACATQSFSFVVLVMAVFALGYPLTIRSEEAFLRSKFGDAFERFCARTPRFFPNLRNYHEAATWVVHPERFRRTMVDVVWFVWLVAIVQLALALKRDLGVPQLLQLW